MLLAEVGLAALLMWFDMRVFWLYFFAVVLWSFSRVLVAITANHLELRIHLETIQNRVGVVPGVDADALVQQMRGNMSEEEWRRLSEMFKFARPGA
jgi:hypothetical protein